VRASRRWTSVALAWAVAASAIAVIALLAANDDSNSQPPGQTSPDPTPRIERLEKQTNDRLDAFGRRLNGTAKEADLQKLEKRLAKAEDDAATAKEDAAKASGTIDKQQTDIDDLKQRVDELEKNQQSQGDTTTP
jgi:septal ring factor EnvC (AmiA/AmiB activator)